MPGILEDSLSFIIKSFRLGRILGLQSGFGGRGYFFLPLNRFTDPLSVPGGSVESQNVHPLRCVEPEENVVERLAGGLYLSQ